MKYLGLVLFVVVIIIVIAAVFPLLMGTLGVVGNIVNLLP
jgi:hypothetical protein